MAGNWETQAEKNINKGTFLSESTDVFVITDEHFFPETEN